MDEQIFKFADMSVQRHSWCVEWFGSQGDFIAGKAKEPISLSRFAGLHGRGRQGSKAQKGDEVLMPLSKLRKSLSAKNEQR